MTCVAFSQIGKFPQLGGEVGSDRLSHRDRCVQKGRLQLEKPEGVEAISGDVIIGGQGLNDCLFWNRQVRGTDRQGVA